MTESEARKRWNATVGARRGLQGMSAEARSFVQWTMERNQALIVELELLQQIAPAAPMQTAVLTLPPAETWFGRWRGKFKGLID